MRKFALSAAALAAAVFLSPVAVTLAADEAAPSPKSAEVSTPAEVKPAEVKPAEAKPAEVKPAEAKPAEAKPAEVKPAEAKPAEAKPAEDKEAKAPPPVPSNAPVVVVNGKPILKAEYDRAMSAYLQQFQQMSGSKHGKINNPNDTMKEEVLGQLVARELLYQESAKTPTADLSKKVDEEMKSLQARFPSPEAYQEALKAQDLTEEALRDLVTRQASVRNYVEAQIAPTVKVSDEDVKKFYEDNKTRFVTPEQVKASHILIRTTEGAKPEDESYKKAKAKAEELQKKAKAGEDFAKLCKENSEDPGSKDDGGDLGFFTKDRMVEPFAKAAFALKVDEVSDVVETKYGFHVIKLFERKDAVQHPFEEVKDDIAAYLNGQAIDKAVESKVAEMKKVAKIDVVAPHL